jgi:hypothetical protein
VTIGSDRLDPTTLSVTVAPTAVAWRFNRQLCSMCENAPHLPAMTINPPRPR